MNDVYVYPAAGETLESAEPLSKVMKRKEDYNVLSVALSLSPVSHTPTHTHIHTHTHTHTYTHTHMHTHTHALMPHALIMFLGVNIFA